MTLAGYDHLLAAARRLQWDAEAIELRADRAGVQALTAADRAMLTELVCGFWVAEHAVADALAPFCAAAGEESARACFAVQAGDEARHARFFVRVAEEVLGLGHVAVRAAVGPVVRELFEHELPALARTLAGDGALLAEAVGLYHLVLEGIVFAVGQDALLELCDRAGGLAGLREGVARVQADERWHIGLGVLALQGLGAGNGPAVEGAGLAQRAGQAMAAWGPAIATPERLAWARRTHARRLRIAGAAGAVDLESGVR